MVEDADWCRHKAFLMKRDLILSNSIFLRRNLIGRLG